MDAALILLTFLGVLGGFDTLWYHEIRARLPSRSAAILELRLHAFRDLIYAVLFGTLGWIAWSGVCAWILLGLLLTEILITFWDFSVERRTRILPEGEHRTHLIMGIVYGAFLACIVPEILVWAGQETGFVNVQRGVIAWVLTAMAAAVMASAIRDLSAANSMAAAKLS